MIAPQTTLVLREMRGHLTNPKVLAAQAAAAPLLGQSGHFGTSEVLPALPRRNSRAVTVLAPGGKATRETSRSPVVPVSAGNNG